MPAIIIGLRRVRTHLRDNLTKEERSRGKTPSVWMDASYQGDFPSISTVQQKAEDSADLVIMMYRCIFEGLQALHVKGGHGVDCFSLLR